MRRATLEVATFQMSQIQIEFFALLFQVSCTTQQLQNVDKAAAYDANIWLPYDWGYELLSFWERNLNNV